MDPFARWFVVSALGYLLAGSSLGLAMGVRPDWLYYLLPAHAHLNLVGWMSFMIFGVGYHILPRFSGRPLHSTRLAWWHLGLAQGGLLLQVAGFIQYRLTEEARGGGLIASGGTMLFLGMLLFVYNIARTLRRRPEARA